MRGLVGTISLGARVLDGTDFRALNDGHVAPEIRSQTQPDRF